MNVKYPPRFGRCPIKLFGETTAVISKFGEKLIRDKCPCNFMVFLNQIIDERIKLDK